MEIIFLVVLLYVIPLILTLISYKYSMQASKVSIIDFLIIVVPVVNLLFILSTIYLIAEYKVLQYKTKNRYNKWNKYK